VKKDEEYLLSVETDAVEIQKLSCELFGQELAETHTVVEAMLMDFRYAAIFVNAISFINKCHLQSWRLLHRAALHR